jgi:hypothetical protein
VVPGGEEELVGFGVTGTDDEVEAPGLVGAGGVFEFGDHP